MNWILGGLVLGLVACGGGGGDDGPGGPADPKLIAGGGVADAPIDGTLHVHVIAADSSPIAGATVHVGGAMAMTSAAGLATFSGVSGPQTVTAAATGHAATTWFGVEGANVTLPLELQRAVSTAQVSGTIAGWNSLPAPALGHYTLGVVLYSFLDDPAAPENAIPQPMNGATPLNTCVKSGLSAPACAWQLNTRIGKQVHTAVIVDGDANGTASDLTDDTYTLIGYAAGETMTLTAGQQVTGESLAMVSGTQTLNVTFPAAPAGLANVVAIPELALGDAGRIVFPLPTVTPANRSIEVLAPTGRFEGSYELVALATPNATATSPWSSAFVHGASTSATIPAWMTPPASVTGGNSISFTGAAGVAFHTAQLTRGSTVLWNVTLLDGSTSFTLPAIAPDPLGSGTVTVAVSAADVAGFEASRFELPATKAALARAAGAQATFTR